MESDDNLNLQATFAVLSVCFASPPFVTACCLCESDTRSRQDKPLLAVNVHITNPKALLPLVKHPMRTRLNCLSCLAFHGEIITYTRFYFCSHATVLQKFSLPCPRGCQTYFPICYVGFYYYKVAIEIHSAQKAIFIQAEHNEF